MKKQNNNVDKWRIYEQRKREAANTATTTAEYESMIRQIAKELGI